MNKTIDINDSNIINKYKYFDNQYGTNIGINERCTKNKNSKLDSFKLNNMIIIKKR